MTNNATFSVVQKILFTPLQKLSIEQLYKIANAKHKSLIMSNEARLNKLSGMAPKQQLKMMREDSNTYIPPHEGPTIDESAEVKSPTLE